MLKRRSFIKKVSAATLAGLVFPYRLLAMPSNKEIGIQLYTIRNHVNEDLAGTLKILKEIGYSTIEAAGYSNGKFYGLTPKEFNKMVTDAGLKLLSSHCGINIQNAQQISDVHLEAGISYLVIPSIPADRRKTLDDFKALAGEFNEIGEICNKKGLTFGYHNHAFEFEKMDKKIPYDTLLKETDADYVFFQMDTYWVVYGGYAPLEYFKKFPGRFKLLHLKDMDNTSDKKSTEIGKGIINFPKILNPAQNSGMEYFFVEQEDFLMDPILSITESFNYLNSLNY